MASAAATKDRAGLVRPISVSAADGRTIARLYERRFHAFVGGAYAVLGEPEAARDAVQEAFARALRDARSFRGEGTLEGWLWRIVVNVARDAARRSRFADLSADELAELVTFGADRADAGELREELRALPERQRLAVFLHYYADLPYDEVARLLEVAPGTIAASLNAARKTLRHRIEEAYE
jgi:RNA polymerase sigma-70 factor (ECF subfamily)